MSLMDLMSFDAENQADMMRQPLLTMAGDIADTRYMTKGYLKKQQVRRRKNLS